MLKELELKKLEDERATSLNPYFNGTCSKSQNSTRIMKEILKSLNPYFNGTCSKSKMKSTITKVTLS